MKKTLKKCLSLLLICSLLLSLAGCNTSSKPAGTGTTASSEATSELSSEASSDDVSTEAAEKKSLIQSQLRIRQTAPLPLKKSRLRL